jgi:hypothetical protein
VNGLYWGKLSDSGEKIRLRDPQGNTVISVEFDDDPPWPVSPDGLGNSLVLSDFARNPDHAEAWRASSQPNGSPGRDDPAPPYGLGVVINEVLAHTDPPAEDAIELRNTGIAPVDISGWYLSDDFVHTNSMGAYGLKKYRIPAGTVIPPGGYRVVYQREFQASNPLVPFALSEFGESVYLSSANTTGELTGYVVGAAFGPSENGVSMGRHLTSMGVDFVPLSQITFGDSGTGAPNAPPRVGPVVFNEIMYNPAGDGSEFLELLNFADTSIDLSGWRIAGADFTFPTGAAIAGNGLLLVLKTNTTAVAAFRTNHQIPASVPIYAHDFVLENEGETVRLEKPNTAPLEPAIEVDRVRYNDKSPWPGEADGAGPSLERFSATDYGNDPINWHTVQAGGSPGRMNQFPVGLALAKHSGWKYHDRGSNLGTAWQTADYSDSSWPSGDGPLGYGANGLATVLSSGPDPTHRPVTVYLRKEFVINDSLASISNLRLMALYDDGFVLYLNGTQVLHSASMPSGTPTHTTTTSTGYNSTGYETYDLSPLKHLLRLGVNLLCVEVHQESPSSDDLLWDASLTYDVATQPTVALPTIAPAGGVFTAPVQVAIQTTPSDAAIRYTLNGTDPDQTSTLYTGVFTLASSAQVRARAYRPGYNASDMASAAFVVTAPGSLEIPSLGTLNSSGIAGGPFSPSSITYTLTNLGNAPLDWTATHSQPWVSLSASGGTLAANGSTTITLALNTNANHLPPGSYADQITFLSASVAAEAISRPILLTVKPRPLSLRAALQPTGDLQITLQGAPVQPYVIESSTDFLPWSPVVTNLTAADGTMTYQAPIKPGTGARLYRARQGQ